jgi:hypothetical protein
MPELEPFFVVWDCPIDGGCSRKKPDICYDFGIGCMIIEIDENGHPSYSCEMRRLLELFQDLAERHLAVIRMNPDKYKDRKPMFKRRKNGVNLICDDDEFQYRMDKLIEAIRHVYNTFVVQNKTLDKLFNIETLFLD